MDLNKGVKVNKGHVKLIWARQTPEDRNFKLKQ